MRSDCSRIKARSIDARRRAVGGICTLYTADKCWNYLQQAGYALDKAHNALT
jgi:hypothetical protein